jgi:hypothetical protein
MDDNYNVFDDIMTGLHEIEEHEKGNITLRSNTVTLPNEDADNDQLLWIKISELPKAKKQKVVTYVDELIQA